MSNLTEHSNPYQSPQSTEPARLRPDEKRFRWGAVLAGWGIDIGGTMILSFVMGIVLGVVLVSRSPGTKPEDLMKLAANPPIWIWLPGAVIGFGFTIAGGFTTAWMAPRFIWKHVWVMSLFSFGTGVFMLLANAPFAMPTWWQFAVCPFAIPAALFGGWLRIVTRKKTA